MNVTRCDASQGRMLHVLRALWAGICRLSAQPVLPAAVSAALTAAPGRFVAFVVVPLTGQHLHLPHLLLPDVVVVVLQTKAWNLENMKNKQSLKDSFGMQYSCNTLPAS